MKVQFIIFRFQPDLSKDEWVPLGIVAEDPSGECPYVVGVCYQSTPAQSASEVAAAILKDIPSLLRQEMMNQRDRIDKDFLECLRAASPWSFHFSVPETAEAHAEELLEAGMSLFTRHVDKRAEQPRPRPVEAVSSRSLERIEVQLPETRLRRTERELCTV